MTRKFLSVHDSHCCSEHGCKYGDPDCSVVLGYESGVLCEECEWNEQNPDKIAHKNLIKEHDALNIKYALLVPESFDIESKMSKQLLKELIARECPELRQTILNAERIIKDSVLMNSDLDKFKAVTSSELKNLALWLL